MLRLLHPFLFSNIQNFNALSISLSWLYIYIYISQSFDMYYFHYHSGQMISIEYLNLFFSFQTWEFPNYLRYTVIRKCTMYNINPVTFVQTCFLVYMVKFSKYLMCAKRMKIPLWLTFVHFTFKFYFCIMFKGCVICYILI